MVASIAFNHGECFFAVVGSYHIFYMLETDGYTGSYFKIVCNMKVELSRRDGIILGLVIAAIGDE